MLDTDPFEGLSTAVTGGATHRPDGHTWASRPWSPAEASERLADIAAIEPPGINWADGSPVEGPAPEPSSGTIRDAVLAALRAERHLRLARCESALNGSTQMEREALCEWLGGMLHRPPLENPTRGYVPMRALVEALWWDLADRTPDPLEPEALSPAILPNHPWGEGSDA